MDPVFSTFVAKLFQDSFRNNVVKQDFRLKFDRSADTLVGLMYKFVGREGLNKVMYGSRFNVFNSSSFSANLLSKLLSI